MSFNMKKFLTSLRLLEGVAVILENVKIEEVDQTMVEIETVIESITAEEMETMTPEVEVEVQGVIIEVAVQEVVQEAVTEVVMVAVQAVALVAVQVAEENLGSIETTVHQKALVVVVDVAATIRVNRETITTADESACAASETGFDILQTRNAAYD